MKKGQQSTLNLHKLGYQVEYRVAPRGSTICVAIKDGEKNIYGTTVMNLEKNVMAQLSPEPQTLKAEDLFDKNRIQVFNKVTGDFIGTYRKGDEPIVQMSIPIAAVDLPPVSPAQISLF